MSVNMEQVKRRAASASEVEKTLPVQRFDQSANSAGQDSMIAEFRVQRPLSFDPNKPFRFAIPAHESFTTDGTSGNTETFSLANNLIDSPATQSVMLFEEGEEVAPDAVDFSNDSFDYTDDGTSNTLDVFYTVQEAGTVTVVKATPGKRSRTEQEVFSSNVLAGNTRDMTESPPLRMATNRSDFHGVVPSQFYVRVFLDAPWQFRGPQDRANGTATPDNFRMDFPIKQAKKNIPGLGEAVRRDMGTASAGVQ